MRASPPRRAHFLVATFVVLLACGGPLPGAVGASAAGANGEGAEASASKGDASGSIDDGSVAVALVHAMTILSCSGGGCGKPDASDSLTTTNGGGYRVAVGSGTGLDRSREQALSDVYRELRDRTGFGSKMVAVSHHEAHVAGPRSSSDTPKGGGTDPLILASFEILDAVDREGRVTLDVFHGRTSCKIALATGDSDAGGKRCLVDGPEHGSPHEDPVTPREREKRFGL